MSEAPTERLKVEGLKPSLRNLNVVVKVVDIGQPRNVFVRRDGSEHRVTEALVGDETGTALLNLWDAQIDLFALNDVIEIKNGYTSLFRGSLRLNIGRQGTAEKVDTEIEEVNKENNISEKRYTQARWYRSTKMPFRRRRRKY